MHGNADLTPLENYGLQAALRDEGIAAIMSHNETWAYRALKYLKSFSEDRHNFYWKSEFTPTDIRIWLSTARPKIEPDHPNAWGGFRQLCVKEKLFFETDLPWRKTGAKGRRQPVYRWRSA